MRITEERVNKAEEIFETIMVGKYPTLKQTQMKTE